MTPDPTTLADRVEAKPDPRDPDPTRAGIFVYHDCWKCQSGAKSCVVDNPRQCEFPHARND